MNAPAGANAPERNMAGRLLGRYQVLTQLASGGMASVYIARATGVAGFERLVAIKVLHPHLAYEEEFISMFLDEARLAARIRHPNVVPTLDINDSGGDGYYLVMEYIEGDHLGALLGRSAKQGKRLPTDVVLKVVVDALGGLGAAHSLAGDDGAPLNIVHRDVSPHNIMVGTDGISRLTDFGVAKAEVRMASTRAGQFKGKLSYMAPEQASTGEADQRSDLFSMGIILWESLTGRRLFRGENNAATLAKILNDPIPLPSSLWPDLEPFDALLAKALDRDPNARFQSADDFIEAIEETARTTCGLSGTRAIGQLTGELTADKLAEQKSRVAEAIASLGSTEIGETSMPIPRDGSGSLSIPSVSGQRAIGSSVPIVMDSSASSHAVGANAGAGRGIKALVGALLLIALLGGALLAWQVVNRPAPTAQPLPEAAATGAAAAATTEITAPPAAEAVAEPPAAPDTESDPSEATPESEVEGETELEGEAEVEPPTVEDTPSSGDTRRRRRSTSPTSTTTVMEAAPPPPAEEMTVAAPPPPAPMMDSSSAFMFGDNPYLR